MDSSVWTFLFQINKQTYKQNKIGMNEMRMSENEMKHRSLYLHRFNALFSQNQLFDKSDLVCWLLQSPFQDIL